MHLHINREKFLVIKDSQEYNLPKKEFEVLCLLCTIPGKVFSRSAIFQKIWGETSLSKERTVDVHIVNLRKKLGNDLIRTIKGVGYKMTTENVEVKE